MTAGGEKHGCKADVSSRWRGNAQILVFKGTRHLHPTMAAAMTPAASFCRVRGCRFPHTHVTQGHNCGLCGQYGHGQRECQDYAARRALAADASVLPPALQCTAAHCERRQTHTLEAHVCEECCARGDAHTLDCIFFSHPPVQHVPLRSATCPMCRTSGTMEPIFVDATCCVCLEGKSQMVVFSACKHASVCVACSERL